jgi:hypothetical protein
LTAYDNTTGTFTAPTSLNGGINGGADSVNQITRLIADDVFFAPGFVGQSLTQITFAVVNTDPTTAFTARPRLRFYVNDGAGGGPGTLINGFSFNPINFAPGTASAFFFNPAPGAVVVPATGAIWAGMTFDNLGATATFAQLNELGQAFFDPPSVGSSTNNIFTTTGTGSFLASNPPGTIGPLPGGTPNANIFYKFEVTAVPEPTSLVSFSIRMSVLISDAEVAIR